MGSSNVEVLRAGIGRFNQGDRMDANEFIEDGDEIFVAGTQSARGRGSRIEVTQDIFHVYRMREGKVVELRLYADGRLPWTR